MGKAKNIKLNIEALKAWIADRKINKGRPKPQKTNQRAMNG